VEIVAETLYQETRKTAENPRILVCAPSSTAINEVARRLAIKFPQNIDRSSTVKPVKSKWIYCVLNFFLFEFILIVFIVFSRAYKRPAQYSSRCSKLISEGKS